MAVLIVYLPFQERLEQIRITKLLQFMQTILIILQVKNGFHLLSRPPHPGQWIVICYVSSQARARILKY